MSKHRYEFHLKHFAGILQESEKRYKNNPTIHPGILIYQLDGRTPFFKLQGLARIDAAISGHKKMAERWLLDFKKLEDAFGKYDFWAAAIKMNQKWKFNQNISRYLEEQSLIQVGLIESALVETGWLKRGAHGFEISLEPIERFKSESKKAKWHTQKKERKKLIKFFMEEVTEIEDKLKSNEIDLNQVEEGIHEFRRKLRWLSIYAGALNGKVRIGMPKTDQPLHTYVNPENLAFKHNQLPKNPAEKEHVDFLSGGFIAMCKLIQRIGEIKDPALYTETMTKIGSYFGLTAKEIKKKMGKEYMTHTEAVKQARQEIKLKIENEKLLSHINNYFKKQL